MPQSLPILSINEKTNRLSANTALLPVFCWLWWLMRTPHSLLPGLQFR